MARTMAHPTEHAHSRRRRQRSGAGIWIAIAVGVAVVVAAVVLLTVLLRPTSPVSIAGDARTTMLQSGDEVPTFSGPGLTGGTVDWAQFRGSPTVLAVWAPWCPHCQAELPVLGQVSARFPGVKVVTVESAVGARTGPSGEGFFAEHRLFFPTVVDDGTKIMDALGVSGTPTIYFVGSDGRVVDSAVGELSRGDLTAKFRSLAGLEQ